MVLCCAVAAPEDMYSGEALYAMSRHLAGKDLWRLRRADKVRTYSELHAKAVV